MTTDTERLDVFDLHGLCLTTHDTLGPTGWTRVWVCSYLDRAVVGTTLRQAIDLAVLDLTTVGRH